MRGRAAALAADGQLRLVWRQPAQDGPGAIAARRLRLRAADDVYATLERRRRRAQIAARHALAEDWQAWT
jgi:hypothetical protein